MLTQIANLDGVAPKAMNGKPLQHILNTPGTGVQNVQIKIF
jgi:hypothetical protein